MCEALDILSNISAIPIGRAVPEALNNLLKLVKMLENLTLPQNHVDSTIQGQQLVNKEEHPKEFLIPFQLDFQGHLISAAIA
jgi:hypothetical protein